MTDCVFNLDTDTTAVIKWVEVPRTNPVLPFNSVIGMTDWTRDPWGLTGVGEVFGALKEYVPGTPPAGLVGDHHCGTREEFEKGGQYLPDTPPAEYDAKGFLRCCNVPPDPPPPNFTCEDAWDYEIGTEVVWESNPGIQRWWTFNKPDNLPMHIRLTLIARLPFVGVNKGECNDAQTVAVVYFGGCATFTISTAGVYKIATFAFDGGGVNSASFKVDYGACP